MESGTNLVSPTLMSKAGGSSLSTAKDSVSPDGSAEATGTTLVSALNRGVAQIPRLIAGLSSGFINLRWFDPVAFVSEVQRDDGPGTASSRPADLSNARDGGNLGLHLRHTRSAAAKTRSGAENPDLVFDN